ncbi:response regulator [Polaribacter haliotis]|uniref:Response regulator n=1 Tax=Polaribacter haliotis TaxID=1888915 RepID=A0A7L8ADG5_9FLAO|nr:response regulator [Polaribacter haliotis]QOD60046.1 response regulator [Polaribacter haliotis]
MKAHILIVEDQPALYERLRRALVKQRFTVDEYTKSYDEAILRIKNNTPDVVLLDIDLQGKKDGLDLGKILQKEYKIPFIYVTEFDDDMTFQKGLNTNHESYIVKTKPRLNIEDVTRAIHTVLHKKQENELSIQKDAVIGLVGYLDDVKEYGKSGVTRVPIAYKDIAFFTVKPFINQDEAEENLRANYLWFQTVNNEYYFLKSSLKEMVKHLPLHFIRINESYIVNLSPEILEGRINGSRISVMGREIIVKNTYKNEFEKRLKLMYH